PMLHFRDSRFAIPAMELSRTILPLLSTARFHFQPISNCAHSIRAVVAAEPLRCATARSKSPSRGGLRFYFASSLRLSTDSPHVPFSTGKAGSCRRDRLRVVRVCRLFGFYDWHQRCGAVVQK